MSSPLAEHLADRFASDARALRARAAAVAKPGARGGGGPGAASLERMAAACDRVEALFAGAGSDEAARALLPQLAGLVAGARTDDERHVYAGAVSRLTDALRAADGEAGADDADDADDDEEGDDR